MTHDREEWLERNNAYLGAALAHLRQKLRAMAPAAPARPKAAMTSGEPNAAETIGRLLFGRRAQAPQFRLLPPADRSEPAGVAAAAERLCAASAGDPPPALLILARDLGLSDFERDILLMCVAGELDPRICGLFAAAQGNAQMTYPTFALAMALLDDPAWEAISPERPLRFWPLIEVRQTGATPLTARALRAEERIVNYIKGLNHLDHRLAQSLEPIEAPRLDELPASHQALAAHLVGEAAAGRGTRFALLGPDRRSKQALAAAAAAALGLETFRLSAESLPAGAELDALVRVRTRENLLRPFALYLDCHDAGAEGSAERPDQRIRSFAERAGGLTFIDLADAMPGLAADARIDVFPPTPGEQRQAWAAALGEASTGDEMPALLASHFDLNLADIGAIAREAIEGTGEGSLADRLWDRSVARARPMLAGLAQRVDVKPSCRNLVLPDAEMALLRQIISQVQGRARVYDDWGFRDYMNRGLGITALFAGDSGTGKTMAAETIADALRLDLYRIDLSAVVSKYIGETEKKLRAVFGAAEAGGAILLFDEADALFGKRSEVKDSHDRFANIEIDYLLQRMETFAGLAILATNMKSALDPAFTRRLRFIVNFPYPGPAERRRIWATAFPPETPLEDVDFDQLARLNLTGGNIHSVAVNAAFMAAAAKTKVTMPLLLEAGRMELRKLDRPVNAGDFRRIQAVGGGEGRR